MVGGEVAYSASGSFNFLLFCLTLFGGLLIQAGTNIINDWKDAERDNENAEVIRPFTGGSRMIQFRLILRGDMGFALSFIALLIGILLITDNLGRTSGIF